MPEPVGRILGSQAAIRIEFETERFNRDLTAYAQTVRGSLEEQLKTITIDLLRRVQLKTPVDTGRLRASFHAVLPGQPDTHQGRGLRRTTLTPDSSAH